MFVISNLEDRDIRMAAETRLTTFYFTRVIHGDGCVIQKLSKLVLSNEAQNSLYDQVFQKTKCLFYDFSEPGDNVGELLLANRCDLHLSNQNRYRELSDIATAGVLCMKFNNQRMNTVSDMTIYHLQVLPKLLIWHKMSTISTQWCLNSRQRHQG